MIARKLGVGNSALGRWVEREAQEGAGALVPVSVGGMCRASLGGEAGGLTLVTPAGYRLEGLDLLSAAKLLEKLG
jgi:transposase-like protein